MKETINFFQQNYTIILSILAFVISLINLLYLVLTNNKKLLFNINNYTIANVDNKHFYMFNIELINKSRLPISINEIIILDDEKNYIIIKSPRLLAEKNTTRNNEVIKHKEIHSSKFPINLNGLISEQSFIVMYGPEKMLCENQKIILNTNRGKINKKLTLNNFYIPSIEFTKEASEYYD